MRPTDPLRNPAKKMASGSPDGYFSPGDNIMMSHVGLRSVLGAHYRNRPHKIPRDCPAQAGLCRPSLPLLTQPSAHT